MYLRFACFIATLACAPAAGAAEATTYAGTIGTLPVIVELTDAAADGRFVGRYAYLSRGVDIPLHGMTIDKAGSLRVEEEQPCTETLCKTAAGEVAETAPIAAEWTLARDGTALTGTWRDRQNGKSLAVRLQRKAARVLSEDGMQGLERLDPSSVYGEGTPAVYTPEMLPYDFLKLEWPLKPGSVTTIGKTAYRMDLDKRTGLSYPVVLALDGTDPAPLNAYLKQQRLQFNQSSFSCLGRAYLGFGWIGMGGGGTNGYDDGGAAEVAVEHFSPRLMGIVESGSYFCGGAHPSNFSDHRLVDAQTGKALVAEELLAGWVWRDAEGAVVDPSSVEDPSSLTRGPDDGLAKFVAEHLDPTIDAETKTDCGMDELIRTNLAVYFTRTDMVFTFQGLPHVIFACTTDLAKVPLKDARPFLTNAGARYFAVLDR